MVTHSSILGGTQGFPGSSVGKESACKAGDPSSIPELGISAGRREKATHSVFCPGNSMDCIVHGVIRGQTGLSDFRFHWASLVPQSVKSLPAIQETWV